ncbi:hypothetical protein CBL_06772 [Carabus blaptoides fortunei]
MGKILIKPIVNKASRRKENTGDLSREESGEEFVLPSPLREFRQIPSRTRNGAADYRAGLDQNGTNKHTHPHRKCIHVPQRPYTAIDEQQYILYNQQQPLQLLDVILRR